MRFRGIIWTLVAALSPIANGQNTNPVPLPSGPPPTGPQGPVPNAKGPAADPHHPLLASPSIDSFVSGRTLTIGDAVAIALSASRPYANAVESLERARGRTDEARAALNPRLGLNGTFTELDKPVVAEFGTQTIVLSRQFSSIYQAAVSMPIDIAGSIHAAVSQAQFSEIAARIDVNRTRNQIVFDVRNAFYQALRAKAALTVANESLQNRIQQLSDAQKSLSAGVVSRFEVITAQRDVADAQQSVIQARGQITTALGNLKLAMGVDVSTPIDVSDAGAVEEPPGIQPVEIPPIPTPGAPATSPQTGTPAAPPAGVAEGIDLGPEYTSAVQEAVRTRPEVLESDAQISAAQRGVTYARRSSLPDMSLGATYTLQPQASAFTPTHQGALSLMVSVPLFDGGLASARTREAQADLATAQTNRRTQVDTVTLEVQQAYVNLTQARQRVQVAEYGLAQAQEAYRMARIRYTEGITQSPTVSPALELSNAQTTLTQAENNKLNALYDYNVARSQLDRAIGRYSYGVGAGFPSGQAAAVASKGK